MAHNTAHTDWIDCNALRRDARAARERERKAEGGLNDNARAGSRLKLIDPEPDSPEAKVQETKVAATKPEAVQPPAKPAKAEAPKAKPPVAEKPAAKEAPEPPEPKKPEPKKSAAAKPEPKPAETKKPKLAEPEKPEPARKDVQAKQPVKPQPAPDPAPAKAEKPKLAKEEAPKPAQPETKAKQPEVKQPAKPKPVVDPVKRFKRLIRENGPISLAQFMGESNALYYSSRDPLGDEGDFITAPEVSQMFGELIGLWLADVWVRAGCPEPVHYVELGPGRGTLTQDAMRTAERYGLKPQIHFVEGSETLREVQSKAVEGVIHHDDVSTIPQDAPILLVANEFFDALPVHQLICSAQGWHERMVGLEGEKFVFVAGDKPMDSIVPDGWRTARQGTMIETSPAAAAIMSEIADRLVAQGGAALVIDYGSLESRSGSTLQAIRQHKKVDALSAPGDADITAHVDFEMLGKVVKRQGARLEGVEMQGDWLNALGIETRTEALQRRSPGKADVVARQRDRLVKEDQMGLLFKVMGIAAPDWPEGVGFNRR